MKIVLDTNLLLVSISRRSETHRIFEALLDGIYDLCVSTEILLEYEEIIGREMGAAFAAEVIDLLLDLPNTRRVESAPIVSWFWTVCRKYALVFSNLFSAKTYFTLLCQV